MNLVMLQDGVRVGASVAVLECRGAAADLRGGLGDRHARHGGGGARIDIRVHATNGRFIIVYF